MKKLLSIIFLGLLWCNVVMAVPTKTYWTISNVIEEGIFLKADEVIGKTQKFGRGNSEGFFFNCSKKQVSNYTTYTSEEFFRNKEFKIFWKHKEKLNISSNKKIYVEKLSCGDNKTVLYPFIQIEDSDIAYYEFDLGIYELKN